MSALPPLRVLLFRHPGDPDTQPFEDAVVSAFQGGKEAGAYVASGADLGVQLEVFYDAPPIAAGPFLDNFCHTLVLVLVDNELLKVNVGLFEWLAVCFAHASASSGRHRM